MNMPFPGMDPYLEHPVLWEGVHARLIVALANQLQPLLDPRYVTSVEERVFVEGPQRRIPDIWVQPAGDDEKSDAVVAADVDTAVIVEVEELEVRESFIEILDTYNNMKLVTLIEVLSPTNKAAGPGRESYTRKQQQTLDADCHLVEIDLLRHGRHVLSIPEWRLESLQPYDYLVCVNRWPQRHRYVLYPRRLRERLPRIGVPLVEPDPDVPLDIQAALQRVYNDGRYARRIRYDEACEPALDDVDQQWADQCYATFLAAQPASSPPAS